MTIPESNYFSHSRPEIAALVPPGARTVLDIGCGTGQLGRLLKTSRAPRPIRVVGIELLPAAAEEARRHLDAVIAANVETLDFAFGEHFDCVILADVLEHLDDPWRLLRSLRPCLSESALVVASVPNVQQWRIVRDLALGRWEYTTEGAMDRRHLRFFTGRTLRQLFESENYSIVRLAPKPSGRLGRAIRGLTFGAAVPYLTPQFFVSASPRIP